MRVPGATLVAVADSRPGVAQTLAASLGARGETDPAAIFAAEDVDAVVITASSEAHCELVVAAARAGKPVFCEKPMSLTLDDAKRAITATREAGVQLQVGFNRRFAADFAAAYKAVTEGAVGTPQLMRSLTRDPGLAEPRRRTAVDDLHPDPDPRLRRAAVAEPGRLAGRGVRDRGRSGGTRTSRTPACSTRLSSW